MHRVESKLPLYGAALLEAGEPFFHVFQAGAKPGL